MPPPLTMPTQWEIVNQHFVSNVISEYSDQITAISSQIQVLSQPNRGQVHEPGTHGSIFTLMNDDAIDENKHFMPLNEPWMNAFKYDCTKHKQPSSSSFHHAML